MGFDGGDVEGFVEFLQIINQQVGPRSVDRMSVADQTFFEIEATLAPSKNFGDGRLAFQATINGVSNRAVMKVNLTFAATRFEGKAPGALAKAGHLQNLGGGKLIEIANKRMARVYSFLRHIATVFQRPDKLPDLATQSLGRPGPIG